MPGDDGPSRGRRAPGVWIVLALVVAAIAAWILVPRNAARPAAMPSGGPQRIVALGATGVYETLVDFGVEDRIVAVTQLSHYPGAEAKARIPTDGEGVPSVEAILALEPDLVVAKDTSRASLEAVGLRVVVVPTADLHATILEFVRTLGVVLDRRDRADEILGRMESDLARLRERTRDLPRRRVYYEHPGPYRTKGRPTHIQEMIEACGGVNVGASIDIPEPTVNAEFVVEADPEVIVLGAFSDTPAKAAERPGWSSVTAVREGRVFQLAPDDRLLWSSRWVDRAERILLPMIHPEVAGARTLR